MKLKVFIFMFFTCMVFSNAQDCKVLLKTINQSYEGDCKKGKADGEGTAKGEDIYVGTFKKGWPHGNGTYTWNNGDIYSGTWEKGKKNGQGNLVKVDGAVVSGFWKNDKYLGLYENPYKKLDKSSDVSAFTIKNSEGKNNTIRFYIKEDQKPVRNPAANVVVHHGNYTTVTNATNYIELQNVSFPFKAKVYFGAEYIEFELFQENMWDIRTDITRIKGLGN